MKKRSLFKIAVLGACLTLPVSSAYAAEAGTPALPLPPLLGEAAEVLTALAGANMASLAFDPSSYTDETLVVNGKPVAFRAYRNIPYAALPKDAARQRMSIFIPAAYLTGGTINGYTAKTAPIFLPNGVGDEPLRELRAQHVSQTGRLAGWRGQQGVMLPPPHQCLQGLAQLLSGAGQHRHPVGVRDTAQLGRGGDLGKGR